MPSLCTTSYLCLYPSLTNPDISSPSRVAEFIDQVYEKNSINPKKFRMGSRRGCISQVRLQIGYQLVQDYGILLAEVARQLGVSMSAISKAITRRKKE
jgi:hypothetical protein